MTTDGIESASRFTTLLWDIDGTLIDTTHLVAAGLDHVYSKFLNRSMPLADIRAIIGRPLSEQVRIFGEPEQWGADPDEMEAEFIRYWEGRRHEERMIPEVIDTLIAGKRVGKKTALVTSKNHAEIANTLPRMEIVDFVDAIVTADDVVKPKPDPEGVLQALRLLDSVSGEALFIGDTVYDMRAGRAAGVARCAVTWGAAPRDHLIAEEPEFMCDEPAALRALLGID